MSTYSPLPPQVDLPRLEREVIDLWRAEGTFEQSLERSADARPWVFYEGPPTANGMPGTHHVEARVFKDAFPRYRTMKGYHVPRKAGWDCHGLPVELAVEKELGFTRKQDIEDYGIAEFNARCRASVERHVDAFEEMTERMGYWVDTTQAYRTMDPEYVDSVWWALKQISDKGLLVEDYRIAPYCPRDETTLSDHELGQPGGYETVVDPSVFVRFPLVSGPLAGSASLLVWTTTPWTLVSNTAVAVNPSVTYVVASNGSERLVVAEPLLEAVLGEGWVVEGSWPGSELEFWRYSRPFDLLEWPEGADGHFVVLGSYVTTEDGTGLVHQAPAFGADDLAVCKAYGLPVVTPIRRNGTFEPSLPLVGGTFFKTADLALVADLESRGLMFRHLPYEHSYPHCWRCHTALLYYALPSWYIRTTERKHELLRENEQTTWYPDNVKWGRYGDWLKNNVDWSLSRTRYWGTPLPVWRCPEGHTTVVGSRAELGELAGRDLSSLDPHRPYVDEVTFACSCGQTATRVPEVIDGWFDSGAMPFAQWGYPHLPGSAEKLEQQYPAQFICEAQDQTRGWFYTLMVVGTLVFDRSSYENVLCLGLILAEDGKKMSKHLGNVLQPIPLMDEHGADALRWFMFASGSPWAARRVGHHALQEVVRKVLLTYWNTASFLSLYGRTAGYEPGATPAPPLAERPLLDRWALSEAHRVARDVDAAMDVFDSQRVGALLSKFIDDLSNWYVRRSRRRFWDGDPAALATLHECLFVFTLLLAPVMPFTTERVWRELFTTTSDQLPSSVHLAAYPEVDGSLVDDVLAEQMALVRRVVDLGRSARTEHKVRTRQPLSEVAVLSREWAALPEELRAVAREELNVQREGALSGDEGLVTRTAKPNFRALGKRFGKRTPVVAAAVSASDPAALLASHEVVVEGETLTLEPDDFTVTETPKEGWAVASEPGLTVALDLTLTPELVRAGLAREVVRLVQDLRKASGLEVSDRISLWWQASGDLAAALEEHAGLVSAEVLATAYQSGRGPEGASTVTDEGLGLTLWISRTE
ncbi:isoleucyl-tRNA synthetase [Motilibacter peucedani]|uniref:Isoleucine--tRNA ligase n=1 Tax=Motilibacter peucedani TaxID=598650 RepID=A0A420XVQ1_9ACTN|nr:isoleucine--tRNA ligase [Motilibacter peucedani]RKS84290.1 isoleucyl-tRNA synthetase [Motilibacter peucedani]